jgi:DNA-directed RNA polymerase beta subunit
MPRQANELQAIFSSPKKISDDIDVALMNGIISQFPIETPNKRFTLSISDLKTEKREFTHADEKEAILSSKSLTYPIKGTLTLTDNTTGKVVDSQRDFPLMDAFALTGKHTMIYKGNGYSAANQLQLRPGVYTRHRETGELEAHFNTASGSSFAVTLDPQTSLFFLEVGSSRILLAPLMSRVFSISAQEISSYIPGEVWTENLKAAIGKESKVVSSLYQKLVFKKDPAATEDDKILALRAALENSKLDVATTTVTLGKALATVTHETLLRSLRNLVDVHSKKREEDNRDSLQFKKVQNLPDFLETRFRKEKLLTSTLKNRITYSIEKAEKSGSPIRIKNTIISKPYNRVFSSYILESNLVSTPSETNPIESLENVGKVTILGGLEGGISSERGVPAAARDIDPSHLGIIDPSRTPESSHAGIDTRFAISAHRDKSGNLYSRVKDKTGKVVFLSVPELMTSVIGFPNQDGKKIVQVQNKGVLGDADRSKVDYWVADAVDIYTITTNLVPFLNSNHPGRLTMAGKAIPQALSLVHREEPLVQTVNGEGVSFVRSLGSVISQTTSPVSGVVHHSNAHSISVKDKDGAVHSMSLVKNLPFNMKGFYNDETALFKVGDKVRAGQVLVDNNYTKNGALALGKNLEVAYMPYKGYNHEDGLVISETCSKGLSSHHAYKVDYDVQPTTVLKKSLVARYFPGKFTKDQLEKLDDRGLPHVGSVFMHGDPVYIALEKREPSPEDKMLGRLHKNLVQPYKTSTELWLHEESGVVVDAHTEGKSIRILMRSVKELEVGDKLTGMHGNKGIVSLILPDNQMPYNKNSGKPADILINPASVTSRINLGQLMETVASKIAVKTGKPYFIHNFSKSSNIKDLHDELKSHGLEDSEMFVDPLTKKDLGKILTGPQYFVKLYKTSDQNYSARNTGGYDNNGQPTKGGEEGSKSVGYMEMLGLLGSDARKNLKEIATLKSENNSEYWAKFLTGQSLPKPKQTLATTKFFNYLTASGVKTSITNGSIIASPLTDKDILLQSNGMLKEPLQLNAKNLEPEKGGMFDTALTGGVKGTKWTHYKLAESIVNPTFERPVKSLLGLKTSEFEGLSSGALGIVHQKNGLFHIHDSSTGKYVRSIDVHANNVAHDDYVSDVEEAEDMELV